MIISRDQNAGQNHNMKISNKLFERAERFKYLGKTLTAQPPVKKLRADNLGTLAIVRCRIFRLPGFCSKI